MNDYITLDGYKYSTSASSWRMITEKPNTVRYTLAGQLDITYGAAAPVQWVGEILAPVTPRAAGWGTVSSLRTSLAKREGLIFYDHYGSGYEVHSTAPLEARSLVNRWDDAGNIFFLQVQLVKERAL